MLYLQFTPFPTFETERLLLRQLMPSDAPQIFQLRTNEEVAKYLNRPKTHNLEEVLAFMDKLNKGISENQSIIWGIALKEDNKIIASICLWNISHEENQAEIGYEMLPDLQGKGIMNEAIQAVIKYGFETMNLNHIAAYTHHENLASIRLLEKNHFKLILREKEHPEEIIYILSKP